MKESVTYQAIVEEGRAEGRAEAAQAMLLQFARRFLPPPDAQTEAAIRQLRDVDRLKRMADRLPDVADWADLLSTP